ncbi:MAG TPA: discoidin domain-containing protein, partial [Methylomirabilota bacterium]|nr:discoidin domain-containing protein [Methylomirabilota bacterium]
MTLFLMTALLFSIASGGISQINFSQKANAQISSAATSACQKLPIASVSANGNDGNVPANVLDNNLNTRWSNLGVGSFIQGDLGGQKTICSVDIAWYRGNLRVNDFVISVSSDGTSFTNVFTGKSSGTTLSAEKYAFPSVTASFVRITVKGNTENNWASITELSVDATSNNPNTNCIKLPISSVTASAAGDADDHNGPDHDADDGNLPANVLDNNLNTRWSNLGVGSFIQADLGGQKTICSVDIAWYRGNL